MHDPENIKSQDTESRPQMKISGNPLGATSEPQLKILAEIERIKNTVEAEGGDTNKDIDAVLRGVYSKCIFDLLELIRQKAEESLRTNPVDLNEFLGHLSTLEEVRAKVKEIILELIPQSSGSSGKNDKGKSEILVEPTLNTPRQSVKLEGQQYIKAIKKAYPTPEEFMATKVTKLKFKGKGLIAVYRKIMGERGNPLSNKKRPYRISASNLRRRS